MANFQGQYTSIVSGLAMEDIEITHVIPYMMAMWTPTEEERARGAKEEIFYCSKSDNGGFKDKDGNMIPHDAVIYKSLEDLYQSVERVDSYKGAFRYLLNIQAVAERCIYDCRKMYAKRQMTGAQLKYMITHLIALQSKSMETLKLFYDIRIAEGLTVYGLSHMTTFTSKNDQTFRMARAARILKHLKVF